MPHHRGVVFPSRLAFGWLNFHDVGAGIGQDHARQRAGKATGEVDDANAVKRRWHELKGGLPDYMASIAFSLGVTSRFCLVSVLALTRYGYVGVRELIDLGQISKRLRERARWSGIEGERPRAAILVPLYGPSADFRLLYTVRSHQVEHHKGEISFPGGGVEPDDQSLEDTALRESHEEVGSSPQDVRLLGRLDDVITISNFLVTPVFGHLAIFPYSFSPAPLEVSEILEIPVSHLRDPRNMEDHPNRVGRRSSPKFPAYRFGEHLVFGATALITTYFLRMLDEANAL